MQQRRNPRAAKRTFVREAAPSTKPSIRSRIDS